MSYQSAQRPTSDKPDWLFVRPSLAILLTLFLLADLLASTPAQTALGYIPNLIVQATQQQRDAGSGAKDEQEVRTLELGKPIEREMAARQSHAYQIMLTEGQFLNVIVEQRGIDVLVRLLGPDGKQILESDSEIRKEGQETVSQVAEAAGSYRVDVQAKEKGTPAGRYEIRLAELRAATEKDRVLQEARKLDIEYLRVYRAGKYDEARPLAERALEIRQKELASEHTDVATSLNNLANLYRTKGDYAKAEPLYLRALAIREKALGPEHPEVARSLNNLAVLYGNRDDYARSEPLYLRALAILEKALGPEHLNVAMLLANFAELYSKKGDYTKVEPLQQRALGIFEKTLGPEHPNVALMLNNLAVLYSTKGDYAEAERIHKRALGVQEKTLGPEHPDVALSLNNLGLLYKVMGDFRKAESLYQRALMIFEKVFGPEHREVARSATHLAVLYRIEGQYVKAESLLQRALAIRQKTLGPEHSEVAGALNSLANLYTVRGHYANAEPLYQRALAIYEKLLGADHPELAMPLNNLGELYLHKGDFEQAEPIHQRVLNIWAKALGTEHPWVANALYNLAKVCIAKGDLTQAVTFQSRAGMIDERSIALNLGIGSERQKLAYLAIFSAHAYQTLSLHVQYAPNDAQALRLALMTLLQRKSLSLDAMTKMIEPLRRRASLQDQALFDQFGDVTSELAALTFRGPGTANPSSYREQLEQLEERREKLEADLSLRSTELRERLQPLTLAAVQAAIPNRAALVEFALYAPYDVKTDSSRPSRYVAYVLPPQGRPLWVDLGEADSIDRAVTALRKALRDPRRTDVKQLARALDEKVMRPVRKLLGKTRNLLLSPDGALNLIPFSALVDEQDRYLVERYSLVYLTSGRDLLRLKTPPQSTQEPMIVADPDFGEQATKDEKREALASTGMLDLSGAYFSPLPGTAEEAQALKSILPQATVLTKGQATEAALKQVAGPNILHVATHGFFLDDVTADTPAAAGERLLLQQLASGDLAASGIRLKNPLLRSGLGLAGANLRKSGDDDGILTALELAGLNLWGTKLAVLSACDTGVGEVKNGEGVYGLRRALVLAGAETQVMSLWPVSDQGTRDLMVEYYQRLQSGQGRSDAMRQVQLRMRANPKHEHPYYWASFIVSGEWANLEGRRRNDQVARGLEDTLPRDQR